MVRLREAAGQRACKQARLLSTGLATLCVAAGLVFSVGGVRAAQDAESGRTSSGVKSVDAALWKSFSTEAPRAWQRLQRSMTFVKATGRYLGSPRLLNSTSVVPTFSEQDVRSWWTAARGSQDEMKWEEQLGPAMPGAERRKTANGKSRKTVAVINSSYAFVLVAPAEAPTRYSVRFLEKAADAKSTWNESFVAMLRDFESVLYAAWRPYGFDMAELIRSEFFRLKAVSAGEGDRVIVEFDFMPPISPDARGPERFFRLRDGRAVFRANEHWILEEFSAKFFGGTTLRKLKMHYGSPMDGLPRLENTMAWIAASENKWGLIRCEYDWTRDVSSEEFYLSHYGLPEPNFRAEASRKSALVYVAFGVFFLGAAYVAWRRSRQGTG